MSTYPLAYYLYPDCYNMKASEQTLQALKSQRVKTHISSWAERLHSLSEFLFLPARTNSQLLGRILVPLPGADKNYKFKAAFIRITAIALWILTLPLALVSTALGLPLRCIDHPYRPALSYLHNTSSTSGKEAKDLLLTDHPL